ncbi:MAG: T9SS type A sorting domain-containing protein, partial [Flavobacteriales bacterium]
IQTSDGGFLVGGESRSSNGDVGGNNGSGDHWLIKLDGSGNLEWEQNFGGSGSDGALSIVQSSDRGFTIAGNSESSDGDVGGNNGGFDQWVVKLDSTGTIQWEENLGGSAAEEARSIVQTPDGGYGIAGFSASSDSDVSGNNGVWDYWILKLNSSGSIQWEKNYGGSAFEDARSIIHTSDGGFAVAGESKSSDGDVGGNNGKRDFWVLKIDDTTSVSGLKKKKGQRDIAIEIQPNPTSGQLLIDLRKRSEEVRISIRDLTGRPIKRQRVVNAGSFRTSIEGEAGIYFVQLRTQDGRQEVYKVVKE